jgi:hypothetical protein
MHKCGVSRPRCWTSFEKHSWFLPVHLFQRARAGLRKQTRTLESSLPAGQWNSNPRQTLEGARPIIRKMLMLFIPLVIIVDVSVKRYAESVSNSQVSLHLPYATKRVPWNRARVYLHSFSQILISSARASRRLSIKPVIHTHTKCEKPTLLMCACESGFLIVGFLLGPRNRS